MSLGPLIIGIESTALTTGDRKRLQHPAVGGVILFGRNVDSAQQLTKLCSEIHAIKSPRLLITIDQEGGRVQRMRDGFTGFMPPRAIGRYYDQKPQRAIRIAETMGILLASELVMVGVDLTFAPVLDLDYHQNDVIGDRAWHATPEGAAVLAGAFCRGMRQVGLCSVGKHFPGHGFVGGDTHTDQIVDDRLIPQLKQDFMTFAAHKGIGLDAMMLSHIVYPAVDILPASLSIKWINICRQQIQFYGPLFTDDMGMEAAKSMGEPQQLTQRALNAGMDFVLFCNDMAVIDKVLISLTWYPDKVTQIAKLYPVVQEVERQYRLAKQRYQTIRSELCLP